MSFKRKVKDVTEATVISETITKQPTEINPESIDLTDKIREKPSENVRASTEINLDKKDDAKDETANVDFMSKSFIKNIVDKKTVKSGEEENIEGEKKPSVEEVRKQIAEEEATAPTNTMEDFEDISAGIVDVLDGLISSGLRWFAKDNIDTPYSLTATKANRLKNILSKILVKYQAKWSIEVIFICTLFTCFITPIKKARDHRKQVIKLNSDEGIAVIKETIIPTKSRGTQGK